MTKEERLNAEIERTRLMGEFEKEYICLLYTSPSPRDRG